VDVTCEMLDDMDDAPRHSRDTGTAARRDDRDVPDYLSAQPHAVLDLSDCRCRPRTGAQGGARFPFSSPNPSKRAHRHHPLQVATTPACGSWICSLVRVVPVEVFPDVVLLSIGNSLMEQVIYMITCRVNLHRERSANYRTSSESVSLPSG
jgi:hypothetical protein